MANLQMQSLRLVDPTGVLLESVSEPIKVGKGDTRRDRALTYFLYSCLCAIWHTLRRCFVLSQASR